MIPLWQRSSTLSATSKYSIWLIFSRVCGEQGRRMPQSCCKPSLRSVQGLEQVVLKASHSSLRTQVRALNLSHFVARQIWLRCGVSPVRLRSNCLEKTRASARPPGSQGDQLSPSTHSDTLSVARYQKSRRG